MVGEIADTTKAQWEVQRAVNLPDYFELMTVVYLEEFLLSTRSINIEDDTDLSFVRIQSQFKAYIQQYLNTNH